MSWPGFLRALKRRSRALVLLDFDGTLAAIRQHRDQARLSPPWHRLLSRLAAQPGLRVIIVSGRGLPDLRRKAPVPGLAWVGNHGLAWEPARLGPSRRQQQRWRARARQARKALRALAGRYPGLEIEDKALDLSLHLRALSLAQRRRLSSDLQPLLRRHALQLSRGRAVLELRPRDAWDKGTAVQRLRKDEPPGTPCFFAGDDRTDEKAFAALGRGSSAASFKIGPGPTRAQARGTRAQLRQRLTQILRAQA